jgi:hypothetical protein
MVATATTTPPAAPTAPAPATMLLPGTAVAASTAATATGRRVALRPARGSRASEEAG